MTVRHLWATVKAADDAGNGTFEAVASTPTVDRDGEIIAARAFEPLPATVPIHVDHRMDSDNLVGTGRPFYDGDALKIRGRFAGTPKAQVIRQLVIEEHLSSMSVVFTGADVERVDGRPPLIKRAELLAVDFVTIPSNRGTLVTAARSFNGRAASKYAMSVRVRALVELAEFELGEIRRADAHRAAQQTRRALRQAEALLAQLGGQQR